MKPSFDPGKRSSLSSGARYAAGILFFALGIFSIWAPVQPEWVKWVVGGTGFLGFGLLVFWKAKERDELDQEELVAMARQAIKTESARLASKKEELERFLMAYGEWMEFPDFEEHRQIRWDGTLPEADMRIAEIVDQKSDEMLAAFSRNEYWEEGKFQTRKLFLDLFSFMESIAKVYHPEAEKPILETNLESFLKAINRASLQVILLLEEVPLFDVKEMNIRKTTDAVRKASKVYRRYEEIQPYLEPVRYLWQGSKFLLSSNPLMVAGWIAGSELLWKGGKKLGKKAMDAYLLSLMRQSLGIIAWETAGIYDKSFRYRSPDWIYGLELVHFASKFEPTIDILRAVFQELGKLPLRSSYDRIFLYRCVANHVSSKPDRFDQIEWVSLEMARDIADRLVAFAEKVLDREDRDSKKFRSWKAEVTARLGLPGEAEEEPEETASH